jgi:DME family drug/metabolite transporter
VGLLFWTILGFHEMIKLSKNHVGILMVLVSSICFAFVPNSAKIAMEEGSSLFFLIASRYAIGACFLLPVFFITKTSFRVPTRLIWRVVVAGFLALCLIAATYHAVNFLDVGLVLLILYSFPLGVALISHLRGKERISQNQWICMTMVMVGLVIMIFDGQTKINLYGLAVSFFGLFCFVFFILQSNALAEDIGSSSLNFYLSISGLALLAFLFLLSPQSMSLAMPASDKGVMAIFSNGFFYILSWVLFFEGSRIVGATRASLMACLEPLFAALLAMFFLGQILSVVEWIGFFTVLVSVYLFERFGTKPGHT